MLLYCQLHVWQTALQWNDLAAEVDAISQAYCFAILVIQRIHTTMTILLQYAECYVTIVWYPEHVRKYVTGLQQLTSLHACPKERRVLGAIFAQKSTRLEQTDNGMFFAAQLLTAAASIGLHEERISCFHTTTIL
jgi:hypothetical protein